MLRGEGPHLLDVSVGARFKVEGNGVHVSWVGLVSMEKGESVIHSLQASGQHYQVVVQQCYSPWYSATLLGTAVLATVYSVNPQIQLNSPFRTATSKWF